MQTRDMPSNIGERRKLVLWELQESNIPRNDWIMGSFGSRVSARMGKSELIEYTDYGIADRLDNKILINKVFKKNKELKAYLTGHELGHGIPGENLAHDMGHDLNYNKYNRAMLWKVFKFCLRYPKTWTQAFPIRFHKGDLYFDFMNFILWIAAGIVFGVLFWITTMLF